MPSWKCTGSFAPGAITTCWSESVWPGAFSGSVVPYTVRSIGSFGVDAASAACGANTSPRPHVAITSVTASALAARPRTVPMVECIRRLPCRPRLERGVDSTDGVPDDWSMTLPNRSTAPLR